MATILEFRKSERTSGAHRMARSGEGVAPAEIVFFPGVRYERWGEQSVTTPKKSRRRRDRLEREA